MGPADSGNDKKALAKIYEMEQILCPLSQERRCVLFEHRPIQCRLHGVPADAVDMDLVNGILFNISHNIFFAFSGVFPENGTMSFSLAESVSGRFVREYFHYLMSLQKS